MASAFIVVCSEVLCCGDGLVVLGVVALHTFDVFHRDFTCEEGVLTIVFLVASPTRVTAHVDGGTPVDEAFVVIVVVDTALVGDGSKIRGRSQVDDMAFDTGNEVARPERATPWMASLQ